MASEKVAYVFLFTEWHLQQGKRNESPENWPPFCNANPPDGRPLREIVKDIHQKRDKLLPKNFPREEKMDFRPSGSGPEVIGSKAEPKWESVWGVIIDRNAVSANEEKLTSMGVRLDKTLDRRRGHGVELFITPRGDEETPAPLKRYEHSFAVRIVDNSPEFVMIVAGALVESSQRRPNAAVNTYMKENY